MPYKEAILGSYLYIRTDELGEKRIERLRERLTFIPRGADGPGEPICLFDERVGLFGVPLYDSHLAPDVQALATKDLRTTGTTFQFMFKPELRAGQVPVVDQIQLALTKGMTGIILHADPAFGKTVVLLRVMHILGCTTLVVVPRSNLVNQWVERTVEHTTIKRSEIGIVNGPHVSWRGKKMVIGLVHTLALNRLPKEFKLMFGAVFFDEVDHSVPPHTFGPVVTMCPARVRIGCSAELDRYDGMHVVFEKHIGQVTIRGEAQENETMKAKLLLVEFEKSSGKVFSRLSSNQRRGVLLSLMAKNAARNMMLARYVKLLYTSGRRAVVLSDRLDHLVTLRGMAAKLHGVPLSETGYYTGEVPTGPLGIKFRKATEAELARVASDCKVIFATYQKFALGTDIQDLGGLIYATPQSKVVQSKGRIERFLEGKKEPVIVDILDVKHKDAVRWCQSRLSHYREKGMSIKRVGGG